MFKAQMEYSEQILNSSVFPTSPTGLFSNPGFTIPYIIILLIGMISWTLFQFTTELIMLAGKNIIEAIKLSATTVWKHMGFFIGLTVLIILINIAGYILLTLGLIFTVPLTLCIGHVLYQKLFVKDDLSLEIDEFGSKEEFDD